MEALLRLWSLTCVHGIPIPQHLLHTLSAVAQCCIVRRTLTEILQLLPPPPMPISMSPMPLEADAMALDVVLVRMLIAAIVGGVDVSVIEAIEDMLRRQGSDLDCFGSCESAVEKSATPF